MKMESLSGQAKRRGVLVLCNSQLIKLSNIIPHIGIEYDEKKIEELIVDHQLPETAQKIIRESVVLAILVDEVDIDINDFRAIQDFTQKENVPLIVCGKNETEWIMRTNLGKLNYEGLNCGELSLDEYPVHVGSSVLSGQLCTVTTDGVHNLESECQVVMDSTQFDVLSVLSDHVFTIQSTKLIPQGSEVLLLRKPSWPLEHQNIDLSGLNKLSKTDYESMEFCGMLAQQILTILKNPGLLSSQENRRVIKSVVKIEDTTKVALCGDISSNLAQYIKQEINCHFDCFSQKDENELDYKAYNCIVCIGSSFEYRQKLGSQCRANRKPLIVISQEGLAGCLESYIPDLSISYTCLPDPADKEYPHCVMKSFPHTPHQATLWAVNKLQSFQDKWRARNEFVQEHKDNLSELGSLLAAGSIPDGAKATQFFNLNFGGFSPSWDYCVRVARCKMEKYFVHKALQLTTVFPPGDETDSKTALNSDGTKFWSWPKLSPSPVAWDWSTDSKHTKVVLLLAAMFADLIGVERPKEISKLLESNETIDVSLIEVSKFEPKQNKDIVTDETVTKEETKADKGNLDLTGMCDYVSKASNTDESFGLVDESLYNELCIGLGNLRCDMYGIPRPLREKAVTMITGSPFCNPAVSLQLASLTRQVLGDIVSGGGGWSAWISRDGHLTVAENPAPLYTQLIPGPDGLRTSIWDTWNLKADSSMTLQDLLDHILKNYKVKVTSVFHKSKIMYMPMFPFNKADKLSTPISHLVKKGGVNEGEEICLTMMAANPEGDGEDIELPKTKILF